MALYVYVLYTFSNISTFLGPLLHRVQKPGTIVGIDCNTTLDKSVQARYW